MVKYVANMTLLFIMLLLVQVLICNHIMLFGVAMPIVFIYFIIRLAVGINITLVMTLAFIMGLAVDIFADTPGVNALACLCLAVVKKPVMLAYLQHDDSFNEIIPSISTLGAWNYSKYMLSMVLIYCLMFFTIEFCSLANILDILLCSAGSALLTFLLLMGIDSLLMSKREKRL